MTIDKLLQQFCLYESGNMLNQQKIDFLQMLVKTGLIWILRGEYRYTARELIKAGVIKGEV
jgi:hypothetical protein